MRQGTHEILIFTAQLDARSSKEELDFALLSDDERARAKRIKVAKVARRFVAGRAFVREQLAALLSADPGTLRFGYGHQGKPYLLEPRLEPHLEFNVSHSADLAVLATGLGRAVGIDVEQIRGEVEIQALAERFFSPRERDALRSLPAADQIRAFFACWTRKEAYLKARGNGLSIPLDRFDVSLAPDAPPALIEDRGDPLAARSWSMRSLDIDPLAQAALVVEARPDELLALRMGALS